MTPYGNEDTIILGGPFVQSFVVTFDYDKNAVKIGQSSLAAEGVFCKHSLTGLDIVLISVSCIMAVMVGSIIYLKCKKK